MLSAHSWIFDFLKDEKPREKTNTVVPPCIHGNLCRQYLREGDKTWLIINTKSDTL